MTEVIAFLELILRPLRVFSRVFGGLGGVRLAFFEECLRGLREVDRLLKLAAAGLLPVEVPVERNVGRAAAPVVEPSGEHHGRRQGAARAGAAMREVGGIDDAEAADAGAPAPPVTRARLAQGRGDFGLARRFRGQVAPGLRRFCWFCGRDGRPDRRVAKNSIGGLRENYAYFVTYSYYNRVGPSTSCGMRPKLAP